VVATLTAATQRSSNSSDTARTALRASEVMTNAAPPMMRMGASA
jgi:hypothetical protein